MDYKKFFTLIFLILFLNLVSAAFTVGNVSHSIDTSYGYGEDISGWINISLDKESGGSLFEDSFGNSISLFNLLGKNPQINYSCNIENCGSHYEAGAGGTTQNNIPLEEGQELIVGFKFTQNVEDITSTEFKIDSDAGSSCYNQVKIDFFDNGEIDYGNTKAGSESCPQLKRYGCFDDSEELIEATLETKPYCQRIQLPSSPGVNMGAWVKKVSGSATLEMGLYNDAGEIKNSCHLENASTSGGEVSCSIDYPVINEDNYYICINSSGGNYKIRGYSDSNGCAYHENPAWGIPENFAYQIFAESKKFDAVGTLQVNDSSVSGTLSQKIEDYLVSEYGGLCEAGCLVPIKIISGTEQTISLKDSLISYDLGGGLKKNDNLIYIINEVPSEISTGFAKIFLDDGEFSVGGAGNEYALTLGGEEIFSETLSVGEAPSIGGLNPRVTASAFPTTFTVLVSSSQNVQKYYWDFGDGEKETSNVNYVAHTYNSTGAYSLSVTITNLNGSSSSKSFSISVGLPKDVIDELLTKKTTDITNIKATISTFGSFQQDGINSVLGIDTKEEMLNQLTNDFEAASTENDYNLILTDLLVMEVPESVEVRTSGQGITFYPEKDGIDLDVLKEIGGGDYDTDYESAYQDAVLLWNQENMETKVDYQELTARYYEDERVLLSVFDFKIKDSGGISENPYFIVKNLNDLTFKENYLEEEISGYVYIDLARPEEEIVFYTTEEDVSFLNLPAFISPAVSRLSIGNINDFGNGNGFNSRWFLLALVLVLIIIVGGIVYVILQEWYKRKYEGHLFKDRNNLYNILVFIENSRKSGLTDKQIEVKLKKAGWKSEQIDYAIRKHSGRRTGMIELPINKIMDFMGIGNEKGVQKTTKFYK